MAIEEEIGSEKPRRRAVSVSSLAWPLALFLAAFLIRFIGLKWGLPNEQRWYTYHPDERDIAVAVFQLDFFTGNFNPRFYNYPSLFIYLTYLAHLVAAMAGATHQVTANNTALWPYMHDVIFAGRTMSALLGAATVPLVYAIGKRLGGVATGVLAALFLTVTPGHVQHSHFATVDVPATFFITLCLWLALRALDNEAQSGSDQLAGSQKKNLYLAALAAGLAAATKYNAGLVLVAPLLALWLCYGNTPARYKRLLSGSAALVVIAALGFVIGCPGSVFYTREFLGDGQYSGVLYELFVHSRQGHGDIFVGSGNGWWYHLTFNLPFLLTWPLLLAALAGTAVAVRSMRRADDKTISSKVTRYWPLILIVWLAVYFLTTGLSQVRFMRYMLPLAPALCLLAAVALWPRPQQHQRLTPATLSKAIAAIVLLIAGTGTLNVLYTFYTTDPRDQAAAYLSEQADTPATVGLIEPPWFWSPPLTPQESPAHRRQPPPTSSQNGRYGFVYTGLDANVLKASQPQWFVTSEFEWTDKQRLQSAAYLDFQKALQGDYTLAQSFKHRPPLQLPGREFVPHDYLYPNPEVRVYRRKTAN